MEYSDETLVNAYIYCRAHIFVGDRRNQNEYQTLLVAKMKIIFDLLLSRYENK